MMKFYTKGKRVFDLALSIVFIIALSPLLCFVCIMILIESKGGIIFKQERLGYDGKTFCVYKFRTMKTNSTILISKGKVVNELNDERHTNVGRMLRKCSIDELPQLVNVIKNEMSLVGPRPDIPQVNCLYSMYQRKRFLVKPGITGLAQITGRNTLDVDEKWDLDAQYAERMCLILDLKILVKTLLCVIRRKGVYKN